MATARKTTKTETVTKVILELSEDEANELRAFLHQMGNDLARPIADALSNAQPAPLAVGDRVRVTELFDEYTGRVGTLERIDLADEVLPHMVRFDDGDSWWTKGVERV